MIVPAVPSKIRSSLAPAVVRVASPVGELLKVVPQVPDPPTPLPAPAVVSQYFVDSVASGTMGLVAFNVVPLAVGNEATLLNNEKSNGFARVPTSSA